jgi:hypothetical protein
MHEFLIKRKNNDDGKNWICLVEGLFCIRVILKFYSWQAHLIQQHAGVLKYKIEGTFINFKWNSKFYLSTSWSAMNASKVTIWKKNWSMNLDLDHILKINLQMGAVYCFKVVCFFCSIINKKKIFQYFF